MMPQRCLFLVAFVVFLSLYSAGQSFLYPVKVGHKWGYIDRKGSLLLAPQFDMLSFTDLIPIYETSKQPPKTGFRLMQIGSEVGVLNIQHQIIIPPIYQRIYLISKDYFVAHKDQDIAVIDRSGKVMFSGAYQQIKYLGKSSLFDKVFFQVRQDSLWGVYEASNHLILPMQYQNIEFLDIGQGHFLTQRPAINNEKSSIINKQGKTIITPQYDSLKVCAQNLIAYHVSTAKPFWGLMDTLGNIIEPPQWANIIPLNEHLLGIVLSKDTITRLYSIQHKAILDSKTQFSVLKKLDETYAIYKYAQRFGFLDTTGNPVTNPIFFDIAPYSDIYYKVLGNGGWGLYSPKSRQQVLTFSYKDIQPFQRDYAMVTGSTGKGIINRSFEEIIPPIYDTIYIQGNLFRANSGLEVDVYQTNDKGKIIDLQTHQQTNTVQVKKRTLADCIPAAPISTTKYNYYPVYYPEVYPSPQKPNWSNWKSDASGYFFSSHRSQRLPLPHARRILYIGAQQLALVSNTLIGVQSANTGVFSVLPKGHYYAIEIFDNQSQNKLNDIPYLGIRRHDFERGLYLAAVVDTNGFMGLVNSNGQPLYHQGQPFRATYIGEFIDGWAKFCIGGHFKKIQAEDNDKFMVEVALEFWKKFLFDANLLVQNQETSQEKKLAELETNTWMIASTNENPTKWGFIHHSGKIGVPPTYQFAKDMKLGQAEIVQNGDWGVIDTTNRIIIPCEYAFVSPYYNAWKINQRHQNNIIFSKNGHQVKYNDYLEVLPFQDGFSSVQSKQGWGIINEQGAVIVPPEQITVGKYSEGLIAVQNQQGWYFVDSLGRIVIAQNQLLGMENFGNFNDGKCKFRRAGKYGYIDQTGKVVIEPIFQLAFDFQGKVARVVKDGKTGLIRSDGTWILKPERFDIIEPFDKNGLAVVLDNYEIRKKGLLREDGTLILAPYYESISPFSEGLATVSKNEKYGYINREGKLIIPCIYAIARPFSAGLASVKKDIQGDWQYIDTLGRLAFSYTFEMAGAFREDIAFVQKQARSLSSKYILTRNGKLYPSEAYFYSAGLFGLFDEHAPIHKQSFYYGDANGQHIWKQYFSAINPFEGDYAIVEQYYRKGILHKSGLFSLSPKYFALEILDENHVKVLPPAFGIVDRAGKVILPPIFDKITLYNGNVYQVEQGEKVGYTNLQGQWFWELRN